MTKEQEARILSNQVLIMHALSVLLDSANRPVLCGELAVRINDIEQFMHAEIGGDQ